MEQENIRFEKSDLPPDTIRVKLGKDGTSLMTPETLTLKIDYSDSVCTEDYWLYDVPDNFGRIDAERNLRMEVILYNDVWGSKHYNATKLASSVFPVFSKSMMPVTLPHTPFQLRDGCTKLYRNPHNFFYSEMGNIYSSSFFRKKSEEEEEQLFEKLEAVQQFFNYDLYQSPLFHRWLKSK